MNAHDALLAPHGAPHAPAHAPASPPAPSASASLSRDQFLGLATGAVGVVPFDLPGDEGRVFLRPMSGLAREKLEQGIGDGSSCDVRARFAVASMCDEQGRLILGEGDIEMVNRSPWTVLDAIYQAALKVNGMGRDAVDAAAKN